MPHNEKLNQKRLDNLQMSLIDLSRSGGLETFQEDIIILQNPSFRGNWEPYKLKHVLFVLCDRGNCFGAVNLHPFHIQKNSLLNN